MLFHNSVKEVVLPDLEEKVTCARLTSGELEGHNVSGGLSDYKACAHYAPIFLGCINNQKNLPYSNHTSGL